MFEYTSGIENFWIYDTTVIQHNYVYNAKPKQWTNKTK